MLSYFSAASSSSFFCFSIFFFFCCCCCSAEALSQSSDLASQPTQSILLEAQAHQPPPRASPLLWGITNSLEFNKVDQSTSMAKGIFDLEHHFAFYGAYHSHPVNVLIHVIFVWPILFTALLLLAFTAPLCPLPLPYGTLPLQEYMLINWSFLGAAIYALFYASLDRKAGSLAALLCLACWVGSNMLAQKIGFVFGWKVVLVCQVLCWTSQFIGHGVFEKRSPALLDNLVQAFLMAPFFVLLEVLRFTLDYEPYSGFHKRVCARVQANISEWKAKEAREKAV